MNKIACLYFEGNDSKVALFEKINSKLILLKSESIDMSMAFSGQKAEPVSKTAPVKTNGGGFEYYTEDNTGFNKTYLQKLNELFQGEDLSKCYFIPILTEPAVYFQKINDSTDLASLNISANGKIETTIDFVELSDGTKMAVYPSGENNYLQVIDSLARMNKRKFLKIPSVKIGDISLASFVTRRYNFEAGAVSLVLYVGKEYSRLIFLNGNKLSNIGSKVVVGKNSFNAYNVIISKILLEMEHDAIDNLDNIIICGEDDSDELLNIIKQAFPVAKARKIQVEDVEVKNLDKFTNLSGFTIPISVAEEYFVEEQNKVKGINLLPEYVKEEQKIFNVGWQGYILLALILASLYFFTSSAISNYTESNKIDDEISNLQTIQAQNKEAAEKIKSYENKIKNVDQTKATLDQLSDGSGVLSDQLRKLAYFADARRNLWFSQLLMEPNYTMAISGFTYSRPAIKTLSDTYPQSLLESIVYEPLRDTRTFKFKILSDKSSVQAKTAGGKR